MEDLPAAESERDEAEDRITLDLLSAVEVNSAVSQRSLSRELGIALGLTNAYLKRCVRKGLIKVRSAPPNRYLYYVTPKGFSEKSRLTARYLGRSFHFYRQARAELDDVFATCAENGCRRLALYGAGELAEIAILCAIAHPLEIVGVVDGKSAAGSFHGLPLVCDLDDLGAVDGVVVTDLKAPQASFDSLLVRMPAVHVEAPALLKISRSESRGGD